MSLVRIEGPRRPPTPPRPRPFPPAEKRPGPDDRERVRGRLRHGAWRVRGAERSRGSGSSRSTRGGVACAAVMPARRDGIGTAIVGRHPETDVPLVRDPSLSLRHLAIVVHPLGDDRCWFRLIDLRTEAGMRDEQGHRVEHVISEGPIFVVVGRYRLLVVPLCDDRMRWPEDAHEAWRNLPNRVFHRVPGGRPGAGDRK